MTPRRSCVGCREVAAQATLVRFATVDGVVVPDPSRRLSGRGAWLHPRRECFDAAVSRKAFHRAFRTAVSIAPDTIDFVSTWPKSASTS